MLNRMRALSAGSASSKRLITGIGSNVIVQIVIFCSQFLIVPVLAQSWGLKRYGIWLMLSTISAYLSLGDLGLGTAASNQMTMEVARERRDLALSIFQHTLTLMVVAALGLVLLCASVAAFVPIGPSLLAAASETEVRLALIVLALYGTVCLMFSLPMGCMKCVGLYPWSGLILAGTMLCEALTACTIVLLHGTFYQVALGYLVVRSCTFFLLVLLLKRKAPWIKVAFARPGRADMKRLVPPALAVLTFTGAQAMVFQGTTLVIGLAVSSALIASFTTVRTLTRTGVQAVILVNRAVMPEFSMAWAQQNQVAVRRIILTTALSSGAVTLTAGVALAVVGKWFIGRWTGGAVDADPTVLYVLIGAMILNSLWMPLSGLLIAVNKQSTFSYTYLCISISSLLASYFLCVRFGVVGAAAAVLLLDAAMCAVVMPKVLRLARTMHPATDS